MNINLQEKKTKRTYTKMLSVVILGSRSLRWWSFSLCFYIFSKFSSVVMYHFYNLKKFYILLNYGEQKQVQNP